ncbi:MAG: hypothetical protein RJA17_607 [Pseudomonadota bacterium]
MADGFLSRWSRAKTIDRSIREQGEARGPSTGEANDQAEPRVTEPIAPTPLDQSNKPSSTPGSDQALQPQQPAPSMEDAKALSVGDDVNRFMGTNVAAEVRSMALRKLFAMPHYNVRSDMDVYWEDYSNMPKLTAAEVANLQQSESLSLFEDPPWRKEMLQEEADKLLADAAAGVDQDVSQQTSAPEERPQESLVSHDQMHHDGVESRDEGVSSLVSTARPDETQKPGQEGEAVS